MGHPEGTAYLSPQSASISNASLYCYLLVAAGTTRGLPASSLSQVTCQLSGAQCPPPAPVLLRPYP